MLKVYQKYENWYYCFKPLPDLSLISTTFAFCLISGLFPDYILNVIDTFDAFRQSYVMKNKFWYRSLAVLMWCLTLAFIHYKMRHLKRHGLAKVEWCNFSVTIGVCILTITEWNIPFAQNIRHTVLRAL